MKGWLNNTTKTIGIIAACVSAVLWINNSINDVRTELDARIDGLETRMAAIEGKLDILIRGLNISFEPVATQD